MPYLNLDLDYFNHPKTIRLVGLLGRGAEILPIRLWVYAGKYLADTGEFIGFSHQEIESIAKWWGKSGEMVEAMLKATDEKGKGFIEKTERGFKIPNWDKVNGHIIVLKERAILGAKARWNKYRDASGNASAMLKQCSIHTNHTNQLDGHARAREAPILPKNWEKTQKVPQNGEYVIETDLQRVVAGWKLITGYKKDDRIWDKAHYARTSKTAKQLLDFLNDYKNAVDCCQDIYTELSKKSLTCTIETVLKHSAGWKTAKSRGEKWKL